MNMDINQVLEPIDEDRYSTKSVHGSEHYQDFSRYKDMRLSQLFESIQARPQANNDPTRSPQPEKVSRVPSGEGMVRRGNGGNRSGDNTLGNHGASEIFALKREIERKMHRPLHLNVLVIGRKGVGKSSFIKMMLTYVLCIHLEKQWSQRQSPGRASPQIVRAKDIL